MSHDVHSAQHPPWLAESLYPFQSRYLIERNRFEQLFPRHRTVILRGASHYIQEYAPTEIVAAITAWWHDVVHG